MIRDAEDDDLSQIEAIHGRMAMDYCLPDLNSPLFLVRKIKTDDSGKVISACFLRLTAETYLWIDTDLSPRQKLEAMQELQPAVLSEAYSKGLDDIEARVPETIERRFYKRLIQLGWQKCRSGWHAWSRETK